MIKRKVKVGISLALGFAIGFSCSIFAIPLPAPSILLGALLVMTITIGYAVMDFFLRNRTNMKDKN